MLLTGCKIFDRHEVIKQHISTIPAATHFVTNDNNVASIFVSEASVTNLETNVIYTVSPKVVQTTNLISAVSSEIPIPYANIVAIGASLTAGFLGWLAKLKSDKAAFVPLLVSGIESAQNNQDVKKMIASVSGVLGSKKASQFDDLVQSIVPQKSNT